MYSRVHDILSPASVQATEITPDTAISASVSDTSISKGQSIPVTTPSVINLLIIKYQLQTKLQMD